MGSSLVFAQDKNEILKLDTKTFEQMVEKSPTFVNKELWEFLYNQADIDFENENYLLAQQTSEKAMVLANKINDAIIKNKSYFQLAKVEVLLQNYERANQLFIISRETLLNESKRIAPKRLQIETENGFFYYYWSFIYSNPDHTNPYLETAFAYLSNAYWLNNFQSDSKFDDSFVLTSLHIARCFGMKGHPLAKLLWIENAKLRFSETSKRKDKLLFQIHYETQDVYQKLGDYNSASQEFQKLQNLNISSENSKFLYLRALADFNSGVNNRIKQAEFLQKGIELAQQKNHKKQLGEFYAGQMLRLLNKKKFDEVGKYLKSLKNMDKSAVNELDLSITEAVLAARKGEFEKSNLFLAEAEKSWEKNGKDWRNEIFIRSWQAEVLLLQKDYEKLKLITDRYLEILLKHSFVDYLPEVYLYRVKAFQGLGKFQEAKQTIQELLNLIETKRKLESVQFSTGIIEGTFEAYQLQTDLHLIENKITEAFQSSEKLKARWLNDKINGNPLNQKVIIDPKLKSEIFDVSVQILKNPKDEKLFAKLSDLEKKAIFYENTNPQKSELSETNNLLADLEKSPLDEQTAVVSYTFATDGKLNAFVWQKGKSLEVKQLPITKDESDKLAQEIYQKMKDSLFYKKEGKEIFDKLLKPLNLQAKHLIIVPDKSLWKIPFQALSEDGKTYLIENKTISYAPSVSILLNQLKNPSPQRQTFQVFSNALYNNLYLLYADAEANKLAKLFGVKPHLNSTAATFANLSEKSDIVHFSMHAEADNDEAFNSFLAFKPIGKDNGKLTVDELLKMKLKKGSLAFLASCETTNVFNGEGLVSLAWGMMGAGASTVISAQWEANDKSTGQFTQAFYKHYKQGISSAEAMQKASIEMIKNPSNKMNEPFYWAEFTLNGDYR